MQKIEDVGDLPGRIGRTGLLPVAKRGVRDPDVLRDVRLDEPVLQHHPGHAGVGKHVAVEFRLFHVLELKRNFYRLFFDGHATLLVFNQIQYLLFKIQNIER